MNIVKTVVAIVPILLIGGILYIQQQPKAKDELIAFVCTNPDQKIPGYLSSVRILSLSSLSPVLGTKTMTNTTLNDCIRADGLYKIVLPEDFVPSNTKSCIKLSKLDQDSGFIHTAYGNQVAPILAKFFNKASTILLVELDKNTLADHGITLKDEQNKPDGEFFPHLHGVQQIPLAIVRASIELAKQADESWLATCIAMYP